MHTHLNFAFKQFLNFSLLVIQLFNSSIKLFQAINNNVPLRTSLLLNASSPVRHTNF